MNHYKAVRCDPKGWKKYEEQRQLQKNTLLFFTKVTTLMREEMLTSRIRL